MQHIKLDRPIVFFDIETTGLNKVADRIVELGIVKIKPHGESESHVFRVNPGMPIPPEITAIHGISDSDVKECPGFEKIAPKVLEILEGCDLGGYNILGFDIPVLIAEFKRARIEFSAEGRRVLDAQRIFHKREPRDLTAALKYYCGEAHPGAHGAMDDVQATIRVVEGQLERYSDLPRDLAGLDAFCNPRNPAWVDKTGKLKWSGDEVVINFGKKQGKKLRDMVLETSYMKWILNGDFPEDTKDVIRNALKNKFPEPPPPVEAPTL